MLRQKTLTLYILQIFLEKRNLCNRTLQQQTMKPMKPSYLYMHAEMNYISPD